MPALDETLQQKISVLEAKQLKRNLRDTQRSDGVHVNRNNHELISFSCNDYLGLSHHPRVKQAAIQAIEKYGTGAGASRLVTGNHPLYETLETALSSYKGTESACVFGSGYLANIGTIPALVGKSDLIIADKLVHACMIDAARLSGATVLRFAHNNLEHCRMLLESHAHEHHHCLILTETVFSMDGDRAPVKALSLLAKEYGAWLMTDDAHGLGVLPHELSTADIQMGTLSKGAGSYGGYVCGSHVLIDYLKTSARSLIYSTGLPPADVAASIAAMHIITTDADLVAKPLKHARLFTSLLGLEPAQSAIVPLVIGESDAALKASALLEAQGFLVAAIRPPTVPEHTARLRFAFSAQHEPSQIEALAAIIKTQGWLCPAS
jgi:8-amino-7-oxononanoate synthase